MLPAPQPRFKVGDKVRHVLFPLSAGTVAEVRPTPWLSHSPFAYVAEWDPAELVPPPDVAARLGLAKGQKWTIAGPQPEGLLAPV